MSSLVTAQLLFLEAEDATRPIRLYINSPGGSVTSGLAIYDTMQYISAPVHTFCLGQAASMGSLLLAGGEPGKRFSLKNSSVMIHREWLVVDGVGVCLRRRWLLDERFWRRYEMLEPASGVSGHAEPRQLAALQRVQVPRR